MIDYLLKPVHFERFEMAIRRANGFHAVEQAGECGISLREILIKSGTKKILVDHRDDYLRAGV